jgi:hypothetical protein
MTASASATVADPDVADAVPAARPKRDTRPKRQPPLNPELAATLLR